MKSWVVLALALALASVAFADRVFLEGNTPLALNDQWVELRIRPDMSESRDLYIAVKRSNPEKLERLFWEVSDPDHHMYGKHKTIEEIGEMFAPYPQSIKEVKQWLSDNGVTKLRQSLCKGWIIAEDVTFAQMSSLLNITFELYQHRETGQKWTFSVGPYSVPTQISRHVDLVSGAVFVPTVAKTSKAFSKPAAQPSSNKSITPPIIWARYNVSANTVVKAQNNSHAVAEFQGQNYLQSDLTKFFQMFVPNGAPNPSVAKVIGSDGSDAGLEAELDVQYQMGVAPNVTFWFYGVKQYAFFPDLVRWLSMLQSEPQIPWVFSISYGLQGGYPSNTYMNRSDQEYQILGVRGVSIIFSSGDNGAMCEDDCKVLYPEYPSMSTYVTAIGATEFITGNSGPEAAVSQFKSGGGFSDYFQVPSYQANATATYLTKPVAFPPPTSFNKNGRANPDFGALGSEYFQVVENGRVVSVGGTSASAPSFAGIMVLLNDLLLQNGKPTLGFLNPFLYKIAATVPNAFFDVTEGDNIQGCSQSSCGGNYVAGYYCATGYDAVTGMGTPNYVVLKNQLNL